MNRERLTTILAASRRRWTSRLDRLAHFDGPTWRRAARKLKWPAIVGGAGLVVLLVAFMVLYATVELPTDDGDAPLASTVVDRNGEEIATLAGEEFRRDVALADVAPVVVDALIAVEDRRFYDHAGVDGIGIIRAAFNNLRGNELQGGSTLTQQLVKNAYLSSERSITRKAKEAVLAVKLERELTKDEILTKYLETVYFGRGAYGIEAAAELYFATTAADLDTNQASFLIGALQSPSSLDPRDHPDAARARRDEVLVALVETEAISQADADRVVGSEIETTELANPVDLGAGVGAHFVDMVRIETDEIVGSGASTSEGLRIETTLDLTDQRAAETAVVGVLDQPDDPEAALVAIDETGAVRALVGSRDHEVLEVNLALGAEGGGSGRQPGSTFKPVALMAALENGTKISTDYRAPASITVETSVGPYDVSNYSEADLGVITLEEATIGSVNTVYAQIAADVGGETLVDVASRGGIDSELEALPSLALGSGEVAPIEMAELYSTFSRRGTHIEPFTITKITGADGDVLYEHESEETDAFDSDDADTLNYVLQQVVTSGTGKAAAIGRPVAGKTGTTQDFGDAWFAGYTPNYTAVVWMGYPEGQSRPMDDVHGQAVTGGSLPAQIWNRFATEALADVEAAKFPAPPGDALEDPDERTLAVDNAGDIFPGDEIVVSGSGYALCTQAWFVAVRGTDTMSPSEQRPLTEPEARRSPREARLRLAPDIEPGSHVVEAVCDDGSGPVVVADASFTVAQDPDDTTTSTTSTSSTTTTTSTTSAPAPTTRPERSTTTTSTTTRPDDGKRGAGG